MRSKQLIAAALAVAVGAMAFAGPAEARYRHHHRGGDAAVLGLFGFAAGAVLGSALSQPRYPAYYYYQPEPVYVAPPPPPVVYQPAPAYVTAPQPVYAQPEPWTDAWFAYCEDRYQSFNPQNGTFLGYDGRHHFCQ
jgi:hypothetical protein